MLDPFGPVPSPGPQQVLAPMPAQTSRPQATPCRPTGTRRIRRSPVNAPPPRKRPDQVSARRPSSPAG
ncbi:unnamed protein product, partial [Nesidiocoris tenuis]